MTALARVHASSFEATGERALRADPVNAPSVVSKPAPHVENTTSPLVGAVQVNHTESTGDAAAVLADSPVSDDALALDELKDPSAPVID